MTFNATRVVMITQALNKLRAHLDNFNFTQSEIEQCPRNDLPSKQPPALNCTTIANYKYPCLPFDFHSQLLSRIIKFISIKKCRLFWFQINLLKEISLLESQANIQDPSMAPRVGVCYGMLGNNLPRPSEVVEMLKQHNIGKVRLFQAHHEAQRSLANTGIEVTVGVGNDELQKIAGDQAAANGWVNDNVRAFYPATNIKYISVGNEVLHYGNERFVSFLLPAMRNIQTAVRAANLGNNVKVSTTHATSVLGNSYPPSQGEFRNDLKNTLRPLLSFLAENGAPLLANVYPYFSYAGNKAQISLDYALFKSSNPVVNDGGREYRSLFDAMVDAVIAACEREGHGGIEVVITESGWPSGGDDGAATVENARVYNNNLIRHVLSNEGTPRRPGKPIDTYIFAMFNENGKGGPEIERHFGLFYTNKELVYPVNFTP